MQVSEIQLFQINEVNSKILSTKEDIANLRVEMKKRFTEQFKWMFVFTVNKPLSS